MRTLSLLGALILSSLIATATTAAAGCSAHAQNQKTGAGCAYSAQKAALIQSLDIETTRLPSGAMIVVYASDDPETVKVLQASAVKGAESFDCRICQHMARDGNCTVEIASIQGGVVALITAEDPAIVDRYEKQFAAVSTSDGS